MIHSGFGTLDSGTGSGVSRTYVSADLRMPAPAEVESIVEKTVDALSSGADGRAVLDRLKVPVYTTDAQGSVSYWNRACVAFAGREPELGSDRWCVTWHLYTTTGEPLAHEDCPMAQAIREQRPIRDAVAIAERPDGTRRAFRPYPTPLFDSAGRLTGAVNFLIDVTAEQSAALADQATRCRRLADATYDREISAALSTMADGLERTVGEISGREPPRAAAAG
jgi:PAS domain S-box-containing protein